jgi:D-cysteine desulfhydrase family pyridoxal phosphate-dependent enzyme
MKPPAKISLAQLPTPLHRLPRLSADTGCDLWIKRDDLTGFAGGGNKGRKLEYLLADALAQGCDTVVTCGGLQSNFIRQLGGACAVLKLRCSAAVMRMPFDLQAGPARSVLAPDGGNVLLDRLFGVELELGPDDDWLVLYSRMEAMASQLERDGRHVYRIAVGGSSPLGAYAFHEAGLEVQRQQAEPFDWIVFASSSGSTHVGLAYSFRETATRVLGICSDPEPDIVSEFAEMGKGLAELLDVPPLPASRFLMNFRHVGEGYGAPYGPAMEAIGLAARREGVLLDPVYTGKAFAGMLELMRQGEISGRVLFWHTGGVPSLFALDDCRFG